MAADVSGIGFKSMTVRNLETGKPVELSGGKLVSELKKHDFNIFILEGKE